MSGSGPNYSRAKALKQPRNVGEAESQKWGSSWADILRKNKYPKCIELKEKLFEYCPENVDDIDNPPKECKTCPQREAPASSVRERFLKLQEEMRKVK